MSVALFYKALWVVIAYAFQHRAVGIDLNDLVYRALQVLCSR
jgi:hypothetical protein